MKCRDCEFCGMVKDTSEAPKFVCRRNPPSEFKKRWAKKTSKDFGEYSEVFFLKGVWPVIDPDEDWCGEFSIGK